MLTSGSRIRYKFEVVVHVSALWLMYDNIVNKWVRYLDMK